MGIKNSRFFQRNSKFQTGSILMVGLNGAGKTTIANILTNKEIFDIKPTEGYTWMLDAYRCKKFIFSIFDVGSQERIRDLWLKTKCLDDGSLKGVIFVVDSADVERIPEAIEFLRNIVTFFQPALVPVVVIANKQDLPGALTPLDLCNLLSLSIALSTRKAPHFRVFGASAADEASLHNAMRKLCDMIKEREKMFKKLLPHLMEIQQQTGMKLTLNVQNN